MRGRSSKRRASVSSPGADCRHSRGFACRSLIEMFDPRSGVLGIVLVDTTRMNTDHSRHVPTPAILRWVFRHDGMRLTCRVDRQTSGRYALMIIPEGEAAKSLGRVTIYASAGEAIRQHAAVAVALRDLGWTLVERTAGSRRGASHAVAA